MDITQQLYIIEQIKQVKARYIKAIDKKDIELLTSLFAEEVAIDYSECMYDPATGRKYKGPIPVATLPNDQAAKVILDGMKDLLTVHQVSGPDITVIDEYNASAIWSMQDKVFYKEAENKYRQVVVGFGYYYDSYKYENDSWKIASTRTSRLWADITLNAK